MYYPMQASLFRVSKSNNIHDDVLSKYDNCSMSINNKNNDNNSSYSMSDNIHDDMLSKYNICSMSIINNNNNSNSRCSMSDNNSY